MSRYFGDENLQISDSKIISRNLNYQIKFESAMQIKFII